MKPQKHYYAIKNLGGGNIGLYWTGRNWGLLCYAQEWAKVSSAVKMAQFLGANFPDCQKLGIVETV